MAFLENVAKRAIPFATRATLNRAAFETRKLAQENVREQMVTRNKFSEQSIRVVQERRELNIRRQEAVVGSIADYMEGWKQIFNKREELQGRR